MRAAPIFAKRDTSLTISSPSEVGLALPRVLGLAETLVFCRLLRALLVFLVSGLRSIWLGMS